MVTVKSAWLQTWKKNSEGKEFSLFVCGFILGFLTQFYNIFSPFWFMIFAWTLPEIIVKIIPECEKDDPYYINESVKWSRGPRKLICKKTQWRSPSKASFLQTCWKEREKECTLLQLTSQHSFTWAGNKYDRDSDIYMSFS